MPKIKLSEWAERNNLSYITANRHFHAGLIPGAVQLDSGTILVEDNTAEQNMAMNTSSNDAMSLFLRKTVEFSKNNSTVEDFAAFVISNFQLKLNMPAEGPKYSKNKPKPEEVQKHFQQFLPDKEKAEQLKAIKDTLKQQTPKVEGEFPIEELSKRFTEEPNPFSRTVDTTVGMNAEYADMSSILSSYAPQTSAVHLYSQQTPTEGLVTRSVDCNTTPQPINYTGSTGQPFGGASSVVFNSVMPTASAASLDEEPVSDEADARVNTAFLVAASSPFQPTKKELLSAVKVIETVETDELPRKRGRKPTLKR